MKRLINLSAILVLLSVFTATAFAQDNIKSNNEARKMVQAQKVMQGTGAQSDNWVDADGDGICDNFGTENQGQGNGYGLKDGSGGGTRPQDGTGHGKMNGAGNGTGTGSGTGVCDGTGSKGSQRRGGK